MHPFDNVPLYGVFTVTFVSQVLFIELGFRYGHFRMGKPNKAQMAQVRAIMGASLGLLAFMLAFSFNTAQLHFEERGKAYMLEVSAIDSAYRSADLILHEERKEAKTLLREFAALRLETAKLARLDEMDAVVDRIRKSEHIHDRLWSLAEYSMENEGAGEDTSLFAQSVLTMIDAHDMRLQASFFNRVSPIIWLTLYGMAVLSMAVTGYQAGLTRTRSSFATWTLALSFAFVITLITDLDRPRTVLFESNQQLMAEMHSRMDGGGYWESINPEQ